MTHPASSISTPSLDELLRARIHGAINIAGIRYQLLYSLLRVFDLYQNEIAGEVRFEGLEDLDRKGFRQGDTYYQVKRSRSEQGWGWINQQEVLDHFIEVYKSDPDARFVLVTNFTFKGQLKILAEFCSGRLTALPSDVRSQMHKIAQRKHLDKGKVDDLLTRVSFEHIQEPNLIDHLRQAIIRSLQIETRNEDLYLLQLLGCAVTWATERVSVRRQDVEAEKFRVQDWISQGVVSLAVRDRLILPLTFTPSSTTADYYEGKRARPDHIAAALDAPRPAWQAAIEETLHRVKACIIRASSGQGKSTLMYRYAFDHFVRDAVYRLRTCLTEEHVGQLTEYLRSRLMLGVPLLVLVDDLSYSTRLWYQVATELANEKVTFLVAAREEDWYRYGIGMSGFVWDIIVPDLSLQEARDIFRYFEQRGKIAPGVPSAAWAYEQVAGQRLLIEFVYLITHGQMLAERITEQIKAMRGEDPSKIEILRLIATAEVYGSRVPLTALLTHLQFRDDPQATLQSLEHEYIEYSGNECEGLHPIRSQHIVTVLHDPLPTERTLARMIQLLDPPNLATLVANVFATTSLSLDYLVQPMVERCRSLPLALLHTIVEALFIASENSYVQAHKQLFDQAVERAGLSSLLLLSSSTLPRGDLRTVQELADLFPDRQNIQFLNGLLPQFQSRTALNSQQFVQAVLTGIVSTLAINDPVNIADIAQLSIWCQFFNVSAPALDSYFDSDRWEVAVFQSDGNTVSIFLDALYHRLPSRHERFVRAQKQRLFNHFKRSFETLVVEEKDTEILSIEFIVNELGGEPANDQAVSRLQQLHRWFPSYGQYHSQGIYPSTAGEIPPVDNSRKTMAGETLTMMLHAAHNMVYTRVVEERYAPRLAYEWAQQWHTLRHKTLSFVRALITFFERLYQGQRALGREIDAGIIEVDKLFRQSPELPTRLATVYKPQQKAINDWAASMHAFLQQLAEHDPHDMQNHPAFLMRLNLKQAIQKLPAMQQAFDAIFQVEVDHFTMRALDQQEAETYQYLRDILVFWFGSQQRHVTSVRQAIQEWQTVEWSKYAAKVAASLAPLAEVGMSYVYPTKPLDEHYYDSICIGYGVMDFQQQLLQLEIICRTIATLDITYTFLYLVPVIGNRQHGATVTRIERETIQKLVAGEIITEGVYPVSPPEGLTDVLPDLDVTPISETEITNRLGVIWIHLMIVRNMLYFARTRLNIAIEEEAALLAQYEREASKRAEEKQATYIQLMEEALAFEETGQARNEWIVFWAQVNQNVQTLIDFQDIPNEYIPQPAIQITHLDQLLQQYMNKKYWLMLVEW